MSRRVPIEIRQMALEDVQAVVDLGNALFTSKKAPTLYRCWEETEALRLYTTSPETCLVASREGTVVGFALGTLLAKPGSPWKYGWLDWLGVARSCKRQHVAQRLVKQLQQRFVTQEVRIMLVNTYEGNKPALGFFRKFGFGHEIKHVYMSLNLDNQLRSVERHFRVKAFAG